MTVPPRTRILIVDDSAVMRSLLRAVVSSDPCLEVAGTAADGASALAIVRSLQPHIILLDVEMPVMDGLVTLRALRQSWARIPVIMCSSLTQRGAKVTIEALASGAADYVAKPAGQDDRESAIRKLAQELLPKIHALALRPSGETEMAPRGWVSSSRLQQPGGNSRCAPSSIAHVTPSQIVQPISATPSVVVIGASTGGPAALDVVLPSLPADFPLPILVVQHIPELFTRLLAERLNTHCTLRVCEAAEGDTIRARTVYMARGNWHLEVVAAANAQELPTLHLHQGPLENHCRPAVDALFRTAADTHGSGVLAVVLTGMGSDGLGGSRRIREMGGTVLAQDEVTSIVWGMPGAVSKAGLAQRVLPLEMIAPEILRITSQLLTMPSATQRCSRQAVS